MSSPTNPTTTAPRFVRADVTHVLDALGLIEDFKRFVLTRFAEYTRTTDVTTTDGQSVAPVADPFARTNYGFGHWRLRTDWQQRLASGEDLLVEHYLAEDRGPGSVTDRVLLPLDFVFVPAAEDPDYAEYLRLKDKFEGGGRS